ncbi:Transmembrane protein 17 [Acropora cervicornis]|uniref:Transmembrane protein 17 n=1 Tax=Acropora cervicornis TaxID=6130 RepID=A0AAD9R7Y5_ACRCE|nr:Transmembrane protein 17 [Acropora cervicornis]
MADALRAAISSVTTTVFPRSRLIQDNPRYRMIGTGNEIVSNLPLQMSLYFNAYFSPFWFATCIVMLFAKHAKLDSVYKFITIAIYVAMAIVEILRLYLGYAGNLQEKVPELAGFWILTLVLQLPLTLMLLLNDSMLIMPMERAVNIIMAVFVLFEAIQGYRVIKKMIEQQASKFHVQQFDNLIEMQEMQEESMEEIGFMPH